ncbi:hypothetical protein K1T71_015291 [Dendrolimus kikuchii]|nr:hypothetical protein K1T71_014935 [Dendrolimus kikuchii]KAJ0169215.1 hypothetical protein K1T71_015291 [Dendrolimus kikuchii]
MFSRGKLLCRLVNAGEQCDETPKYEPRIKDHHVLECHDSLKMSSSRPYKDLDVFPDPSKEKHRVNFDTQSSPSAVFTDISNKQYHKDVNIGPQGEDHHILEWHSLAKYYGGKRDIDFSPNEKILLKLHNINKWVEGVIKNRIGSCMYEIYLPEKKILLKKHRNQIYKLRANTKPSDELDWAIFAPNTLREPTQPPAEGEAQGYELSEDDEEWSEACTDSEETPQTQDHLRPRGNSTLRPTLRKVPSKNYKF